MEKKTDRRARYTQAAVKDAFLVLIDERPYDKINVTAICKEAEISRATFYLHFENINDVLDQLIDDALLFSEAPSPASRRGEQTQTAESLLPACQRIADSDRYHALFMDSVISDYIVRRIAQHERNVVVPNLMQQCEVTEEEAELVFRFILHGTFAVNRRLGWQKDSHWDHYQSLLRRFISGGKKELRAAAPLG